MDSLKFWGKDDKKSGNLEKQYRIKVADGESDKTSVTVVDKDGARVGTTTANRIVALMYEQLR